jgi:hypothetical protein
MKVLLFSSKAMTKTGPRVDGNESWLLAMNTAKHNTKTANML